MGAQYDLTSSQRLLKLQQNYNVHRQCNNICTSILFDKSLSFDVLKKALETTYDRIDSLRIRITKNGKKVAQYFTDSIPPEIGLLDFTGRTAEYQEKALTGIARKRITYYDKPLSKAYLLKSYDGKQGICFVVSHMILDSWGINVFYNDVFNVYESLMNQKPLPKPPFSYEKLLQKELDYETSPKCQADREFWKSDADAGEPMFTHVNGPEFLEKYRAKQKKPGIRYASTLTLFTKSRNLMLWFPGDVTEKAGRYCADNNLSMQLLFLLAYRNYFAKVNNRERDIIFDTSVARRGTLEEKNCGGSMVHALFIRTILDEDMTFREALDKMAERQAAVYKHADYDFIRILSMQKERYGIKPTEHYDTAMFTFQPLSTSHSDTTACYTNWYDNGAYPGLFYLTVMDGDGTGALKCYYQYRVHSVKEETVKKLHSYIVNCIRTGVENDKITVGELLDLQ